MILGMIVLQTYFHNATQFQKMNIYTKIGTLPEFHFLPAGWVLMRETLMSPGGAVPPCGIAQWRESC
jgi:hypothetical protein